MLRKSDEIPLYGTYDVIVSGGGLAGVVCASALARAGKQVALVERRSALGWEIGRAKRVFADLAQTAGFSIHISELLQALQMKAGYRHGTMNAPLVELILDRWVLEAGVNVLFQGWVSRLWGQSGTVCGVIAGTKEGYMRLDAPTVIETDDAGRLIFPEYAKVPLQARTCRSFLVSDCELGAPRDYALPGGCAFAVYPLGEGLARVDVRLSGDTAESRNNRFFADVRTVLAGMRAEEARMANAKLVFISEEEWALPSFRLDDERLYRKAETATGALLAKPSGAWQPHPMTEGQIAVPAQRGIVYAGPWLPACLDLSGDEETALLNRVLLGENAAAFLLRGMSGEA